MRITVLNGPNLDRLGVREPDHYGSETLETIEARVREHARSRGVDVSWMQSNHEGVLVEAAQALRGTAEGALVNAGGYTHTSVALRDALLAAAVPFVEVHVSNVWRREPFRHRSLLSDIAIGVVAGFGGDSYVLGLDALVRALGRSGGPTAGR